MKSNGHKNTYTDKQIAETLAILDSCGGNLLKASRESGVPRKTLERWAKGTTKRVSHPQNPEVAQEMATMRHESGQSLAEKFEAIAHKCCDVIPDFLTRDKTTLAMVATTAGIATDKSQLLTNKPTSIVGSDSQVAEKAIELYLKAFPGSTHEDAKQQIELASQRVM